MNETSIQGLLDRDPGQRRERLFERMFDRALRKLAAGDVEGADINTVQMGTFSIAITVEDVHDVAFQTARDRFRKSLDDGEQEEGRWLRFFRFIIENWEQIFQAITDIIGMFGFAQLMQETSAARRNAVRSTRRSGADREDPFSVHIEVACNTLRALIESHEPTTAPQVE